MKCPLCGLDGEPRPAGAYKSLVTCLCCGMYDIMHDAEEELVRGCYPAEVRNSLHLLSALTRHMTVNRLPPFVVTSRLLESKEKFQEEVLSLVPSDTDVERKADAILKYVANQSKHPGDKPTFCPALDYPIGYCRNAQECTFYVEHLRRSGFVETDAAGHVDTARRPILVTGKGWERIESLQTPNAQSSQAFVAMSFAPEFDIVFSEGMLPLSEVTGFDMVRVDKKPFNDKICDRIIMEIRRSRFLIAEVTGQSQGVYYEAGYAQGFGLPVVWLCRKKEADENKMHFDTRQFNHILWTDVTNLKEQLSERVLATIGRCQRSAARSAR